MRTQVIVELDAAMSAELDKVASAKERRRSEFIRMAIRRALDEEMERRMAEAYREQPDDEPAYFDPKAWSPKADVAAPRKRRGA